MSRYAVAVPVDLSDDEVDQYDKDEYSDDENCYRVLKYKPPIGRAAGLNGSDFDSKLDVVEKKVFEDIYGDWSGKCWLTTC